MNRLVVERPRLMRPFDVAQSEVRDHRAMIQFRVGQRVAFTIGSGQQHALRKIKQSVSHHNRLGGTRGYLTFIRAQLRR